MYRYSRGQTGQGSNPRPAWGNGARAASPEPGTLPGNNSAGTPLGSNSEPPKDRMGTTTQEEIIQQLENELMELRSACAWKDQRIAELSRTDTQAARLKRDVRQLATELHHTRKQLSGSEGELQQLQAQLARGETDFAPRDGPIAAMMRDAADSPCGPANAGVMLSGFSTAKDSSGGGGACSDRGSNSGGVQLRERIAELQEENRQLREAVIKMTPSREQQGAEGMQQHARPPSGASTQRFPDPHQLQHSAPAVAAGASAHRVSDPGMAPRAQYLTAPAGGQPGITAAANTQVAGTVVSTQHEEPPRQIVYSTVRTENTATIGPMTLQGVGTVDGVTSVAKILLQRIHCALHRRQMGAPQPPLGQPHAHGQPPMATTA